MYRLPSIVLLLLGCLPVLSQSSKEAEITGDSVQVEAVLIDSTIIQNSELRDSLPENMVYVTGGTFKMGDQLGDGVRDELPVHEIMLDDFILGKYEVTFEEFDAFCEDIGMEKPADEGWGRGKRPVINISWFEAIAYCNWLSKTEGFSPVYIIDHLSVSIDSAGNGYRLPTEAEWEYAAKGGNKSRGFRYAGSNELKELGWFGGNSGGTTHPIGTRKRTNYLGIYDLSGNVWEWCWDLYDETYYKISPKNNPQGAATGTNRITRGGSWNNSEYDCRISFRFYWNPGFSNSNLGFRLARNL